MKTSQQGVDLIKKYEGCKLVAYRLKGEKYNTIGYGHYGPDVKDGMVITKTEAEALLKIDLQKFESYVHKYVTDITLTQHRFDALVSYCYNRGPGGLKQLVSACATIDEYSVGIVKYWGTKTRYKRALVNRRKEEKAMFDLDAEPTKSVHEVALEVLDGKWGSGQDRKNRLTAAGYSYVDVQAEVNRLVKIRIL